MFGSIRLFDYRCFRREAPATLELAPGFTAFVGANNAGKSALIRSLYELRGSFSQILNALGVPTQAIAQVFGTTVLPPMYEAAELVRDRDDPQLVVEIVANGAPEDPAYVASARLMFTANGSQFTTAFRGSDGRELVREGTAALFIRGADKDSWVSNDGLRYDIRPLAKLLERAQNIQYVGPFRNAVNEGSGSHFDAQIGTGFIQQWNTWKTGPIGLQNRTIERVTQDIARLIGAESLEISASHDQKTLQISFDRRPHKLQALGSGLAQLIVVLGNALVRRPTFIVIDEPELHLHPGLQLEFLTTLASYASEGVIFATHSIGLARSAADRCFSVRRVEGASSVRPLERTPHYAEFLGSLGIAGLQEIGWDRVLLVEGPKDVRTFQQLLRIYGKDRKTVVLPLGGDSMTNGTVDHELAEVRRLSPIVAAVVDSEREAAAAEPIKARKAFAAICQGLGIACCVTELRAIENYLSANSLTEAFKGRYHPLAPYERASDAASFWGKGESWRAARCMTKADLADTDLGRFLEAF